MQSRALGHTSSRVCLEKDIVQWLASSSLQIPQEIVKQKLHQKQPNLKKSKSTGKRIEFIQSLTE
jgi:hypothetical protein